MLIKPWLRLVRPRFLLASVIAVLAGIAISWSSLNPYTAALTMLGVVLLHASVDMLNDYWDFKRGIDTKTKRTPASGGTGVLPEGILKPKDVRTVGLGLLVAGALVGGYFVIISGPVIAILLGFAIISIYFYSTRIVDSGLAEVFVAIKGSMIVIGTVFIQQGMITTSAVHVGATLGILSALVLFVASFPDYNADKSGGRRTLVIVFGRARAAKLYWLFLFASHIALFCGVWSESLYPWSLACFITLPLAVYAGYGLAKYHSSDNVGKVLQNTILYSRITGIMLVGTLFAFAVI
ncbi:MAG: prenyltransferase [Cenarchaeum symbiont of Oopsacas minuta]|nr:prenyltransferase [Cenarchaeum symbiont of Oopsacas minuta]